MELLTKYFHFLGNTSKAENSCLIARVLEKLLQKYPFQVPQAVQLTFEGVSQYFNFILEKQQGDLYDRSLTHLIGCILEVLLQYGVNYTEFILTIFTTKILFLLQRIWKRSRNRQLKDGIVAVLRAYLQLSETPWKSTTTPIYVGILKLLLQDLQAETSGTPSRKKKDTSWASMTWSLYSELDATASLIITDACEEVVDQRPTKKLKSIQESHNTWHLFFAVSQEMSLGWLYLVCILFERYPTSILGDIFIELLFTLKSQKVSVVPHESTWSSMWFLQAVQLASAHSSSLKNISSKQKFSLKELWKVIYGLVYAKAVNGPPALVEKSCQVIASMLTNNVVPGECLQIQTEYSVWSLSLFRASTTFSFGDLKLLQSIFNHEHAPIPQQKALGGKLPAWILSLSAHACRSFVAESTQLAAAELLRFLDETPIEYSSDTHSTFQVEELTHQRSLEKSLDQLMNVTDCQKIFRSWENKKNHKNRSRISFSYHKSPALFIKLLEKYVNKLHQRTEKIWNAKRYTLGINWEEHTDILIQLLWLAQVLGLMLSNITGELNDRISNILEGMLAHTAKEMTKIEDDSIALSRLFNFLKFFPEQWSSASKLPSAWEQFYLSLCCYLENMSQKHGINLWRPQLENSPTALEVTLDTDLEESTKITATTGQVLISTSEALNIVCLVATRCGLTIAGKKINSLLLNILEKAETVPNFFFSPICCSLFIS